ncbi:hypothetical protein, partial [Shimia isoporae]|uniref:hypothetical protein n=1 Tax=Shimia isoporae TaxID=647720 RepID=UPI001A9E7F3A
ASKTSVRRSGLPSLKAKTTNKRKGLQFAAPFFFGVKAKAGGVVKPDFSKLANAIVFAPTH